MDLAVFFTLIYHFRWNWNTWTSCCYNKLAKRKHGTVESSLISRIMILCCTILQRSVAEVQWKDKKTTNIYRLGHRGKVTTIVFISQLLLPCICGSSWNGKNGNLSHSNAVAVDVSGNRREGLPPGQLPLPSMPMCVLDHAHLIVI